uniref:Uncharacterized protein MANES_01G177900 n=1 Tax=Rhizophora mucronata TaxID=61149 RepID=A0A2P2J752_RHIMU
MDEEEFQRLLDLFPIVRPRDYHIGTEPARQSSCRKLRRNEALKKWQDAAEVGHEEEAENQAVDPNDAFWKKLKLAAEKKVCL